MTLVTLVTLVTSPGPPPWVVWAVEGVVGASTVGGRTGLGAGEGAPPPSST